MRKYTKTHWARTAQSRRSTMGRLLLMTLLLCTFLGGARAQETVTIGDSQSTTTQYTLPINTYYNYSLTQQIFTADEIGMAGTITSISFEYTHTAALSMEGVQMYMMNVDKDNFENTTDMVQISASDLVWEGVLEASESGWITIDLDTPFEYDGQSNLLICFYDPTDGYLGSSFKFRTTSTTTDFPNQYLAIAYYNDSSCPSLDDVTTYSSNNKSRYQYRANIMLDITPSGGTVCPKPTLSVSGITHNEATLTVGGGSGTYNVQYKAANATDWADVAINTTETTFTINGLTPLTAYDVQVQSVCDGSTTSYWRAENFSTTAVAEAVGDSWSDDFEGASCGWEFINGELTNAWAWGTAASNGGSHALYISNDGGITNAYTYTSAAMVYATKLLNFTEGKYEFSYDWLANGESNYDYLRVALVPASVTLTDGTSTPSGLSTTAVPTGWIAVDGNSKLNLATEWQNKAVAVNVPAGNYYLVLAWRDDTSSGNNPPAAIDNVTITRISCEYDVTDLAVDDITSNSAILTWTAGEATQWQVVYADNASFENATEAIVSEATYTMTGLQPASTYYAKVRAYCGDEDFGAWSTEINLLTDCVALTDYPYTENFDSYTATSGFLPVCWNRINTGTSYPTYPYIYGYSAHSTSNCLYFYSYGSSSSTNTSDQYAILPPMENLAGKQITLFAKGYNNQSTFTIGTMTNPTNVTTFTAIATQELTNTYQEFIYDVPATATDNYIAIMMERPNESNNIIRGVYIDDISIDFPPSCPKPTVLTVSDVTAHTVQVSWTSDADAWQICLNDNEDNLIDVSTNPYTLEDLADVTAYTVKVRSNCGSDGYSEWSNEVSFTTPIACPAPTGLAASEITGHTAKLNWTGNSEGYNVYYRTKASTEEGGIFEGFKTTSIPSEWNRYGTLLTDDVLNGTTALDPTTSGWNFGSANGVFDFHAKANIYSTGAKYWLVTPSVEVAANYVFDFDLALTKYSGTLQPVDPTQQLDDKFVVLISTDDMATWTILRQWDNAGSDYVYNDIACTANGEHVSFDLSAYVDQNVRIAFYGESTVAGGDNELHIDNVLVGIPVPAGEWQTVPTEETTYTITGLTPEKEYEVKVESDCEGEQSHETAIISFTTNVACPAPTGLAAANVGPTSVDLSWTEKGEATAWQIQVGEEEPIDVDENPYTVTGLIPETDYTIKVRANGGEDGYSEWSGSVTFTTLEACPMPDDLAVSDITYNSATVAWTGFNDSYVVSYRTAAGEDAPFKQNFEKELGEWTFTSMNAVNDIGGTGNNPAGIYPAAAHSGSNGFRFSSYTSKTGDETYDQYLVSPELTVTGELKFYFKKPNTSAETLYFGYSTTTNDLDAFTWTEDLAPTQDWQEYTEELPDDVKYIAFHYIGNYTYYVYVDDITINAYDIPAGEWLPVDANESPVTLAGLEPETEYEVKVQGFCEGEPTEETEIVTFTTPEKTTQTNTYTLEAGENWVSFNIDITLADLEAALVAALPGTEIIINSQSSGSAIYNNGQWRGALNTVDYFDVSQMYMINVPDNCEIWLEGMPIDPADHPVTICNAYNWIGFPLNESMTTTNAFAGFAVNNDEIISQTGNAKYTRGRWQGGSLTTLEPGKGYIYKSAASEDRTFVFPNYFKAVSGSKSYENGLDSHWTNFNGQEFNYHDYKFNQPLVATIQIDDQFINYDDNWESLEVGAFVGEECRGYAFLEGRYVEEYGDPYPVIEMPVYYTTPGEVVTFKLFNHATEKEYDVCTSNIEVLSENHYVEYVPEDETALVLNFTTPIIEDLLLLDEGTENSDVINNASGNTVNVTLADRTLYKDGDWNTICLPFDVTIDDSPLAGGEARTLEEADMYGTHVELTFGEPVETLYAGEPYIIRWDNDGSDDIYDPLFENVTITSTEGQTIEKADGNVKFIGYYDAFDVDADDNDIYYLTSNNTFKHTGAYRTLHACRAYFEFTEEAAARQFTLNFGENGGTTTGIVEVENGASKTGDSTYDLLGRKAPNGQLRKGLYIKNGHKVVIK